MSEPPERVGTQRLMERHGIRPDTDLGQHFLLDENLVDLAMRMAEVGPDDVVLEVGGDGVARQREVVVGARDLVRIFFPISERQASGFAMGFVVEIEREDDTRVFGEGLGKFDEATVQSVLAIGVAESVGLAVVVVTVVAGVA